MSHIEQEHSPGIEQEHSPGRLRVDPAAGQTAAHLVVLLHGVGASAAGFTTLAHSLAAQLPRTAVVALDAPLPFDGGGDGFQWFSIRGLTEQNRRLRVEEAKAALHSRVDIELQHYGLRDEALSLLGFSQGTIMALAIAPERHGCAAVVGFSGRLATPVLPNASYPPVLLIHGTADLVIPLAESRNAANQLLAAGNEAHLMERPGLGHGIDDVGVAAMVAFLRNIRAVE
jgi:phospholipase/carboxylesterase